MDEDTIQKLENAIAACADKASRPQCDAIEALQYTQAALNAANALNVLTEVQYTAAAMGTKQGLE